MNEDILKIIERFNDLPTPEEIERINIELKRGKNQKIPELFNENGTPVPLKIAEYILERIKFITPRDTEELLYYNGGIYHKGGEVLVKELVQKMLGEKSTKHIKEEVIDTIKSLTYIDRGDIEKNKDLIHLKNGIYDLKNDEFLPFSEDIYSTTQLPVVYNPEADCPKIKQFILEVVGEDQFELAQELFGYCLIRDYPYNKAFMLYGSGKNGKSTFLNLLTRFLGEENVVNVSLQDLLYNRFSKAKLYGKLANIYDDIPNTKLTGTGNFKILTGKGRVWADLKFKNGFEFYNYAKLIFSCNELPRTDDSTEAFFRRWILIKFNNYFDGSKENPNILEEITTEEELSGLFNWALEGLKRIFKQNGFTTTKTTEDVKSEWITLTDPLRAFVDRFIVYDPNSYIIKEELFQRVNEFCEELDIPKLSMESIGKKLPVILPRIKTERKKINGERKRVWVGIKFTDEISTGNEGEKSENVHDVQVFSYLNNNNNNNNNNRVTKTYDIVDTILSIFDNNPDGLSYFEAEEKAQTEGIDPDTFYDIVQKLKHDGLIFEPRPGFLKKV